MSKSNEYLNRCLDVMKADANISEETRIIMFCEYARLVVEEKKHYYCSRCRKAIISQTPNPNKNT